MKTKSAMAMSVLGMAAALGFSWCLGAAVAAVPGDEAPTFGGARSKASVQSSAQWHPDTFLVGFKGGARTASARATVHATMGAQQLHSYRFIPVDVVRVPAGADLEQMISAYSVRAEVVFAEPNYVLELCAVPNDPRFGELWALQNTGQTGGTPGADISAVAAWDVTTGSSDVLVAVIDTGIDYNHPDLAANVWVNPSPTFGDMHGARWTSGTGVPTSGDPMDGHGHGTHVSGTIGAVGNNSVGVVGVNWNVRVMGLKFFDDTGSGGYTADAIAAIEYAVAHGAHLTSNSWGSYGYSAALQTAIEAAGAANQLFVAAAGNDNVSNDVYPHYPASYDSANIISVASSTHTDVRSGFSNWGSESCDLAAPGSSILSTLPGNTYAAWSGTSVAAPHVSGVAALLLARHPGAPHAAVKGAILDGADPRIAWYGLTVTGARLNAAEALRLAGLPADTDPVTDFLADSAEGSEWVDLNWTNPAGGDFQQVLIRSSSDEFPASPTDGVLVYEGTGESFSDGPHPIGQRLFYTAWAEYTGGISSRREVGWAIVGGAPDDWFTEFFATGGNDLAFHTVTFVPYSGPNGYRAYTDPATEFPTDPAGGTPLALSDDSFETVALGGGQQVHLYGQSYGQMYVGSNGYITFTTGETGWTPSLARHFEQPRISGLFIDLNAADGGTVSWKQLADRVAVTFEDVPLWDDPSVSTFQIEMFFDGMIRITWLNIEPSQGLAGLSAGFGVPVDFVESDLTGYPPFDSLTVTPMNGLMAVGYEGGPFDPLTFVYTLTNTGADAVDWTAESDAAWATVSPVAGSLAVDATVDVEVALASAAEALPPGDYDATVQITNLDTGFVHQRMATLTVMPFPGEIEVSDSIPPFDDRDMPFGAVTVGHSRTERITVHNTNPDHDLIVDAVGMRSVSADPASGVRIPADAWTPTPGGAPVSLGRVPVTAAGDAGYSDVRSGGYEEIFPSPGMSGNSPLALFDLLLSFPVGVGEGEYGLATDGQHIYTAKWNGNAIYRYAMDGTFLDTFTIAGGAGNLRDMAFDGMYFYGSNLGNVIYQMDLDAETLVGTISTSVSNIRGIAYDPVADAFWVSNDWDPPFVLVDRSGTVVTTVNAVVGGGIAGLAYDGVSEGGPFLWAYTHQATSTNWLHQIDLASGATVQSFDVGTTGVVTGAHPAGGLVITEDLVSGLWTLFGTSQNEVIWALELAPAVVHFSVDGLPDLPIVLGPGQSFSFSVTYAPNEEGEHAAVARITSNDADEPVVEVTLSGTGVDTLPPDFVVDAIDLDATTALEGGTITTTVTVRNAGEGPGDAGRLDLYYDAPVPVGLGEEGDWWVEVGVMAAGEVQTFTHIFPVGMAGANVLRAFIDSFHRTQETDEDNNQAVANYTVEAPWLAIDPQERTHSQEGAAGQEIAVSGNVAWTAVSDSFWLTVTGGASGEGAGTVVYSVEANPSFTPRSGMITVSGHDMDRVFTAHQDAMIPALAIDPQERAHPYGGATGQAIAVSGNVAWTAVSDSPWLTVTGGASGEGAGTVVYSVAANPSITPRSGTITVSGHGMDRVFTAHQGAEEPVLAIHPQERTHLQEGAVGQAIAVSGNVTWTATSDVPWLTVTGGASGEGAGTVVYSVAVNPAITPRSGTITVSGHGMDRVFTAHQAARTRTRLDFDGDGISDFGVYHPPSGNWYVFRSTEGFWQTQFGFDGTIPIVGDFDGDGIDDFGCYHPPTGMWYIFMSTDGFRQIQFGFDGTIPIVGDFDGDGISDFGVYHPPSGNWYVFRSTEGFWQIQFGFDGTIPIVGDFDGDGMDDFGCYHPPTGMWYIFMSTDGFRQIQFGYAGTLPVVGDFDGDGVDDFGCYHPPSGSWYIFRSTEGFWQTQFGYAGTIPVVGDFDGDGRADVGVYYPPGGNWYIFGTARGFFTEQFGYAGTLPLGALAISP